MAYFLLLFLHRYVTKFKKKAYLYEDNCNLKLCLCEDCDAKPEYN